MVYQILAAVAVFGILVLIHEFGHFVTAKWAGMFVREFAVGFGPKIISRQYGETVYSLRCCPLGGFNDIAGMDSSDDEAGERSYCRKPIAKRLVVIIAGALMNLVMPVFLFWGLFYFNGVMTPSHEPVVGEVIEGRPAALAGLKSGDVIVKLNGQAVSTWTEMTAVVSQSDGQNIAVSYQRDGKIFETTLTPEYIASEKRILIGVRSAVVKYEAGFFESCKLAVRRNWSVIKQMVGGLKEIFSGRAAGDISGPIGVVQMTGEAAANGLVPLINFAALLSLNLGIVNLLPIPALDGGHVIVLLLEAVRGKPLGTKALEYTQMAGVAVLIAIMVFATKNDIVRIFFSQ